MSQCSSCSTCPTCKRDAADAALEQELSDDFEKGILALILAETWDGQLTAETDQLRGVWCAALAYIRTLKLRAHNPNSSGERIVAELEAIRALVEQGAGVAEK